MNTLYKIALTIGIIGCLNWGLVGLFNFNLVEYLFGDGSLLTKRFRLIDYEYNS